MKKSKLGYKRYSPDVNNPYNIIPSGRITMRDVDFPVYGIDDMGNAQMMYPGGEYQFPGNQVFELPMAQAGITMPQPYIRPNFFTPQQIEAAKAAQIEEIKRFATPATGRIEGEGVIDVLLPIAAKPIVKAVAKPLMTIVGDAASYATTQTPLRNAWRLNPGAYQYNLPENTMWRGLGQEGMEDAISSGLFRAKQNVPVEYFPGSTLRASKSFGTNPYFTPKFKTAAEYGDNFIAEVPKGAANWSQRYKRSDWSQVANRPIPIEEGRILQKDWLRGYKPVNISKQVGGELDPEMMFRDKYNTLLKPAEERKFNRWAAKESKRQGRDILMDMGAYDVRGFWKSGDYKRMDQDNHGSDTWKKPNHPTFSNQSRYHNTDGWYGGNWTEDGGYQPSKQTLQMYDPGYYEWMFGTEPNRPEHLDMSRYESGVNAPTPMYYEVGGDLKKYGKGGLTQWFAEKWVDVKTGKECGRSGKDKDGRPYPACRPSRRVNSTTPKTTSEMSSSEKAKFKSLKTSGQRIPYNHKRKQQGGQMSGSLGYDSMYGSPIAAFRYMMNPQDDSKYYGEVFGTKQGPGIAAGLDYDNQKYGTQGMIRLGLDPLRGASIRGQGGYRFNPIDTRREELSWGPYGGVNWQSIDDKEYSINRGNDLIPNNFRKRLNYGLNAQYNRELANRGRFSIEGDVGVGIGKEDSAMGKFEPEPYAAIKATYSPPMYKNTRSKNNTKGKRVFPTTYSSGYQLGGQMTPQGISPSFFTGMKDAAVDAFKSFMSSSDEPVQTTQQAPVDWRKMDRRSQIKYGIDQVVALEPEDRRKVLENLLESTAYMENRYGEDPRAYGRSYTSSFMSIDPIALQDMFTGRGNEGRFNSSQSSQFENFKKLNLPTSQKDFDARLRQDDPVAAMAAARYRYAMVPRALPDMNNPEEMFDYWLKYYNGNGVLKHQSREKAYKDFLKGYQMALAND